MRVLWLAEIAVVAAACAFFADSWDPMYLATRFAHFGLRWRYRLFPGSYPETASVEARAFLALCDLVDARPPHSSVDDARLGAYALSQSQAVPRGADCTYTISAAFGQTPRTFEPDRNRTRGRPERARAVWIASSNSTQPPGPADTLASPFAAGNRATVLYVHGGGYMSGSVDSYHTFLCRLSYNTGARVLAVDYRLAPEAPLPAAFDDAAEAYRWLLRDARVAPDNVVVIGDSAGGGLALATLQTARQRRLAQPAAAVLLSPWLDLTLTSASAKRDADPWLPTRRLQWFAELALRTGSSGSGSGSAKPVTARDARVSPLFGGCDGLAPLLLVGAENEALWDDAVRLTKVCRKAGTPLRVVSRAWLFHCYPLLPTYMPEAAQDYDHVVAFAHAHLNGYPVAALSDELDDDEVDR